MSTGKCPATEGWDGVIRCLLSVETTAIPAPQSSLTITSTVITTTTTTTSPPPPLQHQHHSSTTITSTTISTTRTPITHIPLPPTAPMLPFILFPLLTPPRQTDGNILWIISDKYNLLIQCNKPGKTRGTLLTKSLYTET